MLVGQKDRRMSTEVEEDGEGQSSTEEWREETLSIIIRVS